MTRQLVDVLKDAYKATGVAGWAGPDETSRLVASLLTDGPAEHTIVCPTCKGEGATYDMLQSARCRQCKGSGRRVIVIRAENKK